MGENQYLRGVGQGTSPPAPPVRRRGFWVAAVRPRAAALLATVILLAAGACGGNEPDPGGEVETFGAGICEDTPVLSARMADTSQPLTDMEATARIMVSERAADGFYKNSVIVDQGMGSFELALPRHFAPLWRAGTPTDELEELGRERDPEWMEFWSRNLRQGGTTRAISVDVDRTSEVVAILVTLTPEEPETGAELAGAYADFFRSQGADVGEACGILANGSDGAYVEYIVSGRQLGSRVDRAQLQFLIPDPPQGLLWGVACDVPAELAAELKSGCFDIAASFEPLPEIAGPSSFAP